MKRIQNKLHEIGTYDIFKISLSCFDDKRYVLDDDFLTDAKKIKKKTDTVVNFTTVFKNKQK